MLILYQSQAMLYMKSGTTNPLAVPGFMELMYKSDYQKIYDYLQNGTTIDENQHRVPIKVIMVDGFKDFSPDLFKLVKENYHTIDRVNEMSLLEKNLP